MHDKLKKLLALAEHPNTNPHEAAAAAALAAELAAQHSIDLEALRVRGKEFGSAPVVQYSSRDEMAIGVMGAAVGKLYGCYGTLHRSAGAARGMFSYSGQPHNVAMAGTWLRYLWESCKRANREFAVRSGNDRKKREIARRSFRWAFCDIVAKRLIEKLNELNAREMTASSDGRSIVVGSWLEQERQEIVLWLKEQGMGLEDLKPQKVTMSRNAMEAGHHAGQEVSLQEQIEGGNREKADQRRRLALR